MKKNTEPLKLHYFEEEPKDQGSWWFRLGFYQRDMSLWLENWGLQYNFGDIVDAGQQHDCTNNWDEDLLDIILRYVESAK
jgi:hypothetical protein